MKYILLLLFLVPQLSLASSNAAYCALGPTTSLDDQRHLQISSGYRDAFDRDVAFAMEEFAFEADDILDRDGVPTSQLVPLLMALIQDFAYRLDVLEQESYDGMSDYYDDNDLSFSFSDTIDHQSYTAFSVDRALEKVRFALLLAVDADVIVERQRLVVLQIDSFTSETDPLLASLAGITGSLISIDNLFPCVCNTCQ